MAAAYRVTSQRQTTELTTGGRFQDVMEVNFQILPSGDEGTIRIPLPAYTPDNVKMLLDERAAAMDAVSQLGQ